MAIDYDMHSEDWAPGEVLAEDVAGGRLRDMLDALRQAQGKYKMALEKGVAPDEFAKGVALIASYDAAMGGLQRSWAKRHTRR